MRVPAMLFALSCVAAAPLSKPAIESVPEILCFKFDPQKDLTAYELLEIIQRHILPGTRIKVTSLDEPEWVEIKRHYKQVDCSGEAQ